MTIKVIDFGFCAFGNQDSLLNTICGSLHYLPPECIRGEAYSGSLSDVWSAGVVLFVLLTKLMPFVGSSQPQIIKNIVECNYEIPSFLSPSCADLIRKIFVLDPNKRIKAEEIIYHPWIVFDNSHQKIGFNPIIKPKSSMDSISDQYKLSKIATTRRRSFPTRADICEGTNKAFSTRKQQEQGRRHNLIPKIPQRPCQTFVTDEDDCY